MNALIAGNMWRQASVNVNSKSNYQLSFEAIVGIGFAGDIAIDDITVIPGLCPPQHGCDFERMLY